MRAARAQYDRPGRGRLRGSSSVLAVLLALGVVCSGGGAAWAWRDAVVPVDPPSAHSAGTVDLQVGGLGGGLAAPGGAASLPALSLAGAFPGDGASDVVTVRNAGSRTATVTATVAGTGVLGGSHDPFADFGGTDTGPSCSGGTGGMSVTFAWTEVPGATSYVLRHGDGGESSTTVTGTSHTLTTAIASGTARVVVRRDFGQGTWVPASSNTRSYAVAVVSRCS